MVTQKEWEEAQNWEKDWHSLAIPTLFYYLTKMKSCGIIY